MAQEQDQPRDGASPGGKDNGGIYDRYIDNDNAFDNLASDIGSLSNNLTSLNWLPSPDLGVTLPNADRGIGGLLVTLAFIVVLSALTLAAGTRMLIYSWRIFRDLFIDPPGELLLGHRVREGKTKRARLARFLFPAPRKYQVYDDDLRHCVVQGTTGSGKSTLLAEKVRQRLRHGSTVILLELDGNQAESARYYAELYERPVTVLDPTAEDTGIWNPMAGEKVEIVAEQMVNMIASNYVTEAFFRDIAINLTRHAVIAIKSYEERYGADANIGQLTRFIADRNYRDEVLAIQSDKQAGIRVTAPWIPEYTRNWFEMVYFGQWDNEIRESYTAGLGAVLEKVAGQGALRRIISPPPAGDPEYGRRKDIRIEDELSSGGLVLLRLPAGTLGTNAAVAAAGWITQRIESATSARADSRPLAFVMDEAHLILGSDNAPIADGFRHWLPICRNYAVSVTLAYQSFSMIERNLAPVIQGNTRTKLMAGGGAPDDAEEAERIAGETDSVTEETRTTRRQLIPGGILSSLGQSVTMGERESKEAYYPAHRIRALPVGTWLIRTIDHNNQTPPFLIKVLYKSKLRRRLEGDLVRAGLRIPRTLRQMRVRTKHKLLGLSAPVTAPLLARLQQTHDRVRGAREE